MTTLVIETRVTGSADREDRETMIDVITKENDRRAALDPPGTPLLMSTVAEQRVSYAIIQSVVANDVHRHNIAHASELTLRDLRDNFDKFTDEQRATIKTILDSVK